jgi:hypothetical protein
MIQAYESFPKDSSVYYYRYVLQAMGYAWMIILLTLFTERYFRELIANWRKWEIAIWLNWCEMVLYTTYAVYATVIGCLYFWAVYVKKDYLGPVKTVIYVMNEVVILTAVWEKWTHFLHAGHSVSLYCATEQHIPPPPEGADHGHGGHGGHDDHGHGGGHGHDDHGHGGHDDHKHGDHGHDDHGKHDSHGKHESHGDVHKPINVGHDDHAPKSDHGHH